MNEILFTVGDLPIHVGEVLTGLGALALVLLLVIAIGWVILRAGTPAELLTMLNAMFGQAGTRTAAPISLYLTLGVETALVVAIVGAGPLVPWISRWRVTLDATTAAVVMMVSAFWLFAWRGVVLTRDALRPRTNGNRPRPGTTRHPNSSGTPTA